MKQTIAISAFAEMLARQSGYTTDFCERFVLEMFKTVADSLKESNNVTIKGLGKFSVTEDGIVDFIPDATFAAEINAPFDCFEPEPLDDDITEEQLLIAEEEVAEEEAADDVVDNEDAHESSIDTIIEAEPVSITTDETEAPDNEFIVTVEEEKNETDTIVAVDTVENEEDTEVVEQEESSLSNIMANVSEPIISTVSEEIDAENSKPMQRRNRSIRAFLIGVLVGVVVGVAITYFIAIPQMKLIEAVPVGEQVVVKSTAAIDSLTENAATDSIRNDGNKVLLESPVAVQEVYDTVTSTLAQLSRKHYGTYEFWVYIYEENKDVISNPDFVEPNTRVRIPNAEKYGIDANDRTSINNALKKSQEIAQQRKR